MADTEATSRGFTKKESPIMTKLHLIPFLNNITLQSVEHKKQHWVALRPICEDLGIGIDSQRKKLKEQQRWTCGDITVRDSAGRKQALGLGNPTKALLALDDAEKKTEKLSGFRGSSVNLMERTWVCWGLTLGIAA